MRVIGTAGHVDHGKSTLITALTGINPDRLKEERIREMTIDLGFAWLTLPNGEEVGVVDVPGHRDFIENMLAGVGGIDAAIFVVAADEGVMPQTREHLAILDILQISSGVIALTKVDLVTDSDWLDMVEMDVRQALHGTVLENAPLVRVSARTGKGLDDLKQALAKILEEKPYRPDFGRPRLPVDRVFTVAGFGTVVTGTLVDGQLKVGEEIQILPGGARGRIRGLQTHKRKEETAYPGSRTAVNISGVEVDLIQRGNVVVKPDQYRLTWRLDVQFRLLPDASAPLCHNQEIKLFLGTSEQVARVRLLGTDELAPGQEGWLQLELQDPVVALRGDRYILRRPSPGETLGGGLVVDDHPERRHKRFSGEVIQRLESLLHGSPAEILFQASLLSGAASARELFRRARLEPETAQAALEELLAQGQLIAVEAAGEINAHSEALLLALPQWLANTQQALKEVDQYHQAYPLRRGIPREELKSRLKMAPRLFNEAVRKWVADNVLVEHKNLIARPEHVIGFTASQQAAVEQLLAQFAAAPYGPPSIKECQVAVGEEVYNALVELGHLVPVSNEVVFRKQDYDALVRAVRQRLLAEKTLTVVAFRDQFNTSRRYALAFLEHLDAIGITVREGDDRRLRDTTEISRNTSSQDG